MSIATVLKPLIAPFSLLYGGIMYVRNVFYDKNWYSSVQFDLPVISVGNLSTGGTGKTPHIEYLIRLFQYSYQVATLSRGYKRRTKGFKIAGPGANASTIGDEPFQFFKKFPEITVCVGENRMLAIPELLTHRPYLDVILMDDAFQHRSVKPGLNIMITDYSRPFYNDYILPLGSLREGRSSYQRAEIIIVSKCPEDLDKASKKSIIDKIKPLSHQSVFFSKIVYGLSYDLWSQEVARLEDYDVAIVVAGIANPTSLMKYVNSKVKHTHLLDYPDHHFYNNKDLEEIATVHQSYKNEKVVIVTTEKDATRLISFPEKISEYEMTVLVVPIEIQFLENGQGFNQKLIDYVNQTSEELNEYGIKNYE